MSPLLATYLVRFLQIVWLDLLLSGDNAIVIAIASRDLPPDQRRKAISLGAGAAILLRIAFAVVLLWLLRFPFLRLIGGAFLIWIAVRLADQNEPANHAGSASSLWRAVRLIAFADALMSLDNVLAITAAARGDVRLVVVGLLLSLPLVVFGASIFVRLLERAPWLLWASAALIGWSAGQLIYDDPVIAARVAGAPHADVIAGAAGAAFVIFWPRSTRRRSTAAQNAKALFTRESAMSDRAIRD